MSNLTELKLMNIVSDFSHFFLLIFFAFVLMGRIFVFP